MAKRKTIPLDQIDMTGTQTRAKIIDANVDEYAEQLADGATFPPVVVFRDPEMANPTYHLADGFHRVKAHSRAGLGTIKAEVHEGGQRDALLYALGANCEHGLRRTNEDKRNAVRICLENDDLPEMSARDIAKHCKVSHTFASKMVREYESKRSRQGTPPEPEEVATLPPETPSPQPEPVRTDGKISGGTKFDPREFEQERPTFDDSRIDDLLKQIARALDDRAKVHVETVRQYQVCVTRAKALHAAWCEWRDQT